MARSSSKRVIYAALAGNLLVAMTKFVAAGLTGSAAMLSEAIHSTVDSGNQLLLLLGMRRAARPANTRHPFGHGLQLYFWTFVVAVLIFGVGAGVSVVEGISKIRTLHPVESPWVNYLVLGVALLFEGAVWIVALRAFRETKGSLGWLEAVQFSKDPTVFTVLFEDTAAMLGAFSWRQPASRSVSFSKCDPGRSSLPDYRLDPCGNGEVPGLGMPVASYWRRCFARRASQHPRHCAPPGLPF